MFKVATSLLRKPIVLKFRNVKTFRRNGFTLIELLVVLAIVATLLTLVAPKYFNQIEVSKEAVLLDNLHSTREVINKFYADIGRYPESLDELVEKHYLRSLPYDPIADSKTNWQIVAVPTGYKGNVFDLKSGAVGVSRKGEAYDQW
jgi:general secretion pathway protein G